MTTSTQRLQSLQQFGAALMLFAGAALVVGVALLFFPGLSLFAWPLFVLGLVALLVGMLSYALRVATEAVIASLDERKN